MPRPFQRLPITFFIIFSIYGGCSEPNSENICSTVSCGENGTCQIADSMPYCECDDGYHAIGLYCYPDTDGDADQDPRCSDDDECDDELFCNGEERCAPDDPSANERGCISGENPCSGSQTCSDVEDRCLTSCDIDPDVDDDDYDAVECGGRDCRDDDSAINPGAREICGNGVDDNCDGITDPNPTVVKSGTDIRITDDLAWSESPSLVWADTQFGVVWSGSRSLDTYSQVYFTRINPTGSEISDEVNVTDSSGGSTSASMIWTGIEFALVWREGSIIPYEIFFTLLSEEGIPSPSHIQATDTGGTSFGPNLVWTGIEYGVAWDEYGMISFTRLDSDGTPTGDIVELSHGTSATGLEIVVTEAGYVVVWRDDDEAHFAQISFDGSVITDAVHALFEATGFLTFVATDSEFAIAWSRREVEEGNSEIYLTLLDSVGSPIGDHVRVTNSGESSINPDLVWTGDEFGIVWEDSRDGNSEIYFARLNADGSKIGDDFRVTNNGAPSNEPSLVWTGTEYAVAWADERDDDAEIYFARIVPLCD